MEELPKTYNPQEHESRIYALWEQGGFFDPDKLPPAKNGSRKGNPFCMTMAPPNVTGSLHIGHALEYTQSDALMRFKRMQGCDALWLPGTDHAGIATQNVVEKELKKEGKSRHDLGREKFIERVWQWKEQYGNTIFGQLKRLGTSCDWSRQRFTMDARYVKAVEAAFRHYHEKGWIYKGKRVVSWCTRCRTSLSDLELVYKDQETKLWHIKYPVPERLRALVGADHLTVATTRPETMLGDEAVAVHPKDERWRSFVGQTVTLPIANREIPVIADDAVDSIFGTGAVKVTPAHDMADFEISVRHHLPLRQVIGEDGRMTAVAGEGFAGLTVKAAREEVIARLTAEGLLEKEEAYPNRVNVCYRCDTVIEPIPSEQWFVKMDVLAKKAIAAVKEKRVRFNPERWEKIYLDWLEHIKDWCVSRQLWWGHQIPVWYCAQQTERPADDKSSASQPARKYVVSSERPSPCPFCGTCTMEQESDVLDTWFSSALWPFATLGWPERTEDLSRFYPTQALTNDRGIINLWDARMVYSGEELMGREPFGNLIIHATVMTKEGKRMSKSLGTGVDPLALFDKFGADATRFGLVWMSLGGQDMKFGEEPMIAGKKFLNKLWNATRFVLAKTGNELAHAFPASPLTVENASLKDTVQNCVQRISERLDAYDFGQALHDAHDTFWHIYCDQYIEWAKQRDDKETLDTLGAALVAFLKIFHPFVPFATETLWQHVRKDDWASQLMIAEWPYAK